MTEMSEFFPMPILPQPNPYAIFPGAGAIYAAQAERLAAAESRVVEMEGLLQRIFDAPEDSEQVKELARAALNPDLYQEPQ